MRNIRKYIYDRITYLEDTHGIISPYARIDELRQILKHLRKGGLDQDPPAIPVRPVISWHCEYCEYLHIEQGVFESWEDGIRIQCSNCKQKSMLNKENKHSYHIHRTSDN